MGELRGEADGQSSQTAQAGDAATRQALREYWADKVVEDGAVVRADPHAGYQPRPDSAAAKAAG